MKHTLAAALFASLSIGTILSGPGCTNEGPPPAGRPDQLAPGQYPRAVALEGLAKVLRFGPPNVETSEPGRPMKVRQPVRNLDGRELNVQYRFTFMDDGGRPLKTNSGGWTYKTMAGSGVETMYEANALEDSADDWRLEVRPAR